MNLACGRAGGHRPHGRGADTVVDGNVRDAWRVLPGQLTFDNPKWEVSLQTQVKGACPELGCANTTRPELHNSSGPNLAHYDALGSFSKRCKHLSLGDVLADR